MPQLAMAEIDAVLSISRGDETEEVDLRLTELNAWRCYGAGSWEGALQPRGAPALARKNVQSLT